MESHTKEYMLGDTNQAENDHNFCIEAAVEDDLGSNPVSGDGSYQTSVSEKREGLLMPLDLECMDEA